jgi:hypothetical protein
MLTLNRVHDMQRVPGKRNEVRMVGEHHYVRISAPGISAIFVQDGQFYTEGGPAIPRKDLSEAFWAEARKVSPDMRRTVGLVLPEEVKKPEKVQADTQVPPPPAPGTAAGSSAESQPADVTMKTCDKCQAQVPSKSLGSHMAKHAREERKGT